MDRWFSTDYPLIYSVFDYLTIKELCKWRQTSVQSHTTEYTGNWFEYVQDRYHVHKCAKCASIRSWLKMEWCPLCEHWVCVDHLDRCNLCNGVRCSDCVCDCEWK